MIVKTRDLNGKDKYFDARTGKEVRLLREPGRFERYIPDYAFAFLDQSPKVLIKEPKSGSSTLGFKKSEVRIVPPEKPSWWSRLIQWFKSLFSDGRK